ncbi:MAG: amidase [Polyangiales bacterium]
MNELWRLSAVDQAAALSTRACSSAELVKAHLDRIGSRNEALRAFTEIFADRAMADARAADEARARGDVRGPLHGLPVTVKESIDMAGLAATMGVESRRSILAARDGGMIEMLRDAGAVILGRTNIAQYLLSHESNNPVFGRAKNPFNEAHTPGGSSGGEGAAIAAGMSPLGIGTDIGGSIRVPAHFCGIAGLKPTLDRWTNRGSNTALAGQEAIRGQIGPMARTVGDLIFAMKALDPLRMSTIDARVPPLPFEDPANIDLAGVRVGLMLDDGFVTPSHAILHALERAADALRTRGAVVVPFTPPGIERAIQCYFAALSADGGAIVDRGLGDDEVDASLQSLRRIAHVPSRGRRLGAKIASLVGQDKLALVLSVIGKKSVDELWALTHEIRAYRFTMTDAMNHAGIDAVICAAHATAALPHGGSANFALAGSGSMLWNLVQFPAGVVPVKLVEAYEARRDLPRDLLEKRAARFDKESVGLPVGVQVVARPWRDDLCLAVMAGIESVVKGDKAFPHTPVG